MIPKTQMPGVTVNPAAAPDAVSAGEAEVNLAQLFRHRTAQFGDAPRWRERRDGVWLQATFLEHRRLVNDLISGLDALGVRPGNAVGILSCTRWEWMAADWAIIGLGGVTTTIYASSVPATIAFMLNDSGARYVFVENRAQYDKLAQVRERIPNVRALILFDDGEQVAGDKRVIPFAALQHLSGRSPEEAEAFAAARTAALQPGDRVSIVYTSGTTGQPKGVIHTHRTLLAQLSGVRAMLDTVRPGMRDVLFLPPSHVLGRLEHLFGIDQGAETVVAPSLDQLAEDIREAQPDLLLSVPRVYEKAYGAILTQVASSSALRQRIFRWAVRVGRAASRCRQERRPIPLWLRLPLALADHLVFRRVRAALGGRLQFAITGGAPLDLDILEFFHAANVLLLEGWGLTETGGAFTVNTVGRYRLGSVGQAFPGHELAIAADGEVLVRGPCVFPGYLNNPLATTEAIDAAGWFHTGDIGTLDSEGFLRIVDRKKDLIVTAGGKKIAPQYVEGLIKAIPTVSEACVYGDRKPYLVALMTLDAAAVAAWAGEHRVTYSAIADIYGSPQLRAFLDEQMADVNRKLASYESVKYYDVLADDFTVENDLLTPTLKIRRKVIHDRYHDCFEALYRPRPAPGEEDRDLMARREFAASSPCV
jgi:long-chain acyl-CoA synthetase